VLAESARPSPEFNFVLVSFTHDQPQTAAMASFNRSVAGFCHSRQPGPCLATDQRPNGITSYTQIDRTPAVLATLLAILGAAVLGQFIVVSGRRRRREFAILKALGLLRRQVSSITAWQVSILTVLALPGEVLPDIAICRELASALRADDDSASRQGSRPIGVTENPARSVDILRRVGVRAVRLAAAVPVVLAGLARCRSRGPRD